jgi:chitinase
VGLPTSCVSFPHDNRLHWICILTKHSADILTCQSTYGKKILLSIGGATYNEGGFATSTLAVATANQMWAMFGRPVVGYTGIRPFGSAVLDGFLFDFESLTQNFVPFAQQLRSLMNADQALTGKKYLLSASPQCPFPDANLGVLMNTVPFDIVAVQFYNNYCGLNSYVPNQTIQPNFNFATWDNWARTTSANKAVKIYLGIPASASAAGSGYLAPAQLTPVIAYSRTFASFGGVAMWDASQAVANTGFLTAVRAAL